MPRNQKGINHLIDDLPPINASQGPRKMTTKPKVSRKREKCKSRPELKFETKKVHKSNKFDDCFLEKYIQNR